MFKAILFDFDGTLLNTHDLIIKGLNRVSLKSRGIPFGTSEHNQILGKPLEEQMRILCPSNQVALTEEFQIWYRENHDHYAKPYEDIEDMLQMLQSEGYRLGIVTNNSRPGLQLGLDFLGLEHYFDILITRDDVPECKPSPLGIQKALAQLRMTPGECIYVGDSAGDILAAQAAGVMAVLVAWTAMTLEQVRVLSPDKIIESPYEIPFLLSLLNTEIA